MILGLFFSCAGYRKTKFTLNSLNLCDSINSVIKKYGMPFKTNIYNQNDICLTKIYYKEVVDVSSYRYMLTTELTFKDAVLVKIDQKEDHLQDVHKIINVKSVNDTIY